MSERMKFPDIPEGERSELRLEEVHVPKPRPGKGPKPSPEGMKLPGRGFEEGSYTIKEIFAELAAGGREVPDEAHKVMLIYDRSGDLMTHIPFAQFDRMKDAVEKMALAKRDLDFFDSDVEKALAEWDAENGEPKQRGGEMGH